jgi:hypothetical protein
MWHPDAKEGMLCPARRPAFDLFDLGSFGIIVLALSVSICISAQRITPAAIAIVAALTASSLVIGRIGLRLPITTFRLLAEYLLGFNFNGLFVLIACLTLNISAGSAAALVGVASLAAGSYCAIRKRVEAKGRPIDLLMCGVICLASMVWSWQAIVAMPGLINTGVFNAWSDYFIHSGEIAQFAHFGALGRTSIFAAGEALPLYHYGSYMLPAIISADGGIPALVAATSFWTPLGFILLGVSAAVLGGVLSGQVGGILAVAAVLLVPDAAHYGLQNPFFDFHWLLQVSSGGSYGVAFACFAIAAMAIWLRTRCRQSLVWAGVASLAVFELHVQIFVPLAMTQGLIIFLAWHPSRTWRPTILAITAAVSWLVMALSWRIDRAPRLTFHPIRVLLLMHGMQPSRYPGLYARLAETLWKPVTLAVGLLMLLVAAFGLILPLYLLGLVWHVRRGSAAIEDWIPAAAVGCYLSLVIVSPQTPLEPEEFVHRPFVFVYTILAVWCAHFGSTALASRVHLTRRMSIVASFVLLITPLDLQRLSQHSSLSWGEQESAISIPQGLLEVGAFLRNRATPSDVVAVTPGPLAAALLALSERAAFAPGTEFTLIQSGITAKTAETRRGQIDAILGATNPNVAQQAAACAGAAWLVTLPPTPPILPALGDPAMTKDGFAVYSFEKRPQTCGTPSECSGESDRSCPHGSK